MLEVAGKGPLEKQPLLKLSLGLISDQLVINQVKLKYDKWTKKLNK